MGEPFEYRGVAGEIIVRTVWFPSLLRLVPGLVMSALALALGMAVVWLLKLPPYPAFLLTFLATSPIIGKSAVAAAHGHWDATHTSDWDLAALKGFLARYSVLTVVWSLGAYFILGALSGSAVKHISPAVLTDPTRLFTPQLVGPLVVALLLTFVLAFLPPLTVALAAQEDTVAGCFTRAAWSKLLGRRADLMGFFCAIVGGVWMLCVFVIPPGLLLSALASSVNNRLSLCLTGVTFCIPVLAGNILSARLAGALVARPRQTPAVIENNGAPPPADKAAVVDLRVRVEAWAAIPDTEVAPAITEAEAARREAPDHPLVLSGLAKLYLRASRTPDAVGTAARAISQALAAGEGLLAMQTWGDFNQLKGQLPLDGDTFEKLGAALLAKQRISDAAWCFAACISKKGPVAKAAKGLVAAAETHEQAGRFDDAARIYQYVIQHAAGTAMAQYCESRHAAVQAKRAKS